MPLTSLAQVAGQTFDYIVLGGGTAGLTLASRLSENPEWSVLVLEAGNSHLDNHPLISRPAQYGTQWSNPEYDWGFKTVPQKFSNNRQSPWQRGKGLGGTSQINFSLMSFPPKEDIDNWEKLGNPGWNWSNYEKYASRAVTYVPLKQEDNSLLPTGAMNVWDANKVHGNGPIHITHPRTILNVDAKFYETLLNMGLPRSKAPYHGDTHGVYLGLNNVHPKTNTRTYSATAFLETAMNRANLSVLTGAEVLRILSSDSGNGEFEASAVAFRYGDADHRVNVGKEVVLSAGTLKSPQILEQSGIGRPEILSSIGVEVKVPLEGVGENVQEHQFISCTYELRDDLPDTYDVLRDEVHRAKHEKLFLEGKGLYTTGVQSIAFMPLETVTADAGKMYATEEMKIRQDIQKELYPPGLTEQYDLQLQYHQNGRLDCEITGLSGSLSGPKPTRPGKKYYTIIGFVNHNFSRGTIHSASTNPRDDPVFDPHYFEHDIDLQAFIKQVRYIREIAKTAPFKDLLGGDSATMELNPGPDIQTDEEIGDWLKGNFSTGWHTTGSLSMRPKDKSGVVDPNLKVYGTKNVRVVDLSIVPLQFAAHTQATAYIIAEQAADIMKGVFVP